MQNGHFGVCEVLLFQLQSLVGENNLNDRKCSVGGKFYQIFNQKIKFKTQ